MYVTFESVETEAREFWVEVARGGKEFEPKAPSSVRHHHQAAVEDGRPRNENAHYRTLSLRNTSCGLLEGYSGV
jgi:hypothetical protein